EANLLQVHMVGFGALGLPLFLLVFEFAVIHDPAYGRPLVGGDLDEVKACLPGQIERLGSLDDSQRLVAGANDTDRGNADGFVDPVRLFDSLNLSCKWIGNAGDEEFYFLSAEAARVNLPRAGERGRTRCPIGP